jgi:hypothetical protein
MTIVARIGQIGFEVESVPGVAEVLAAADYTLLVEDLEFTVEPTSNTQNVTKPVMGFIKAVHGGRKATVSFKVGLKGSGTAGTAPAIGKLLRGCQFSETVRAAIGVWYKATTLAVASQTTLTILVNENGYTRTAVGCMGTVKFTGKANEIHYAEFEFTGVFGGDADAAMSLQTLETTKAPPMLDTDMQLLEYHAASTHAQTQTGVEDLRQAAAINVMLAANLNNAGAATQLGRVRCYLRRTGLPVAGANGIRAEIWTNAAGVPGVLVAGATSDYVNPILLRDDAFDWVDFVFPTPVALAGATNYHVVLTGDFVAGANLIDWATYTVAVTSSSHFDAAWAPLAGLEDFMVEVLVAPQARIYMDGCEFDVANTVNLRQDVSFAAEGWDRAFVSAREPMVSVEPELELKASRDMLAYQTGQTDLFFGYRIGSTAGNTIIIDVPFTQITGIGEHSDRDEAVITPIELQVNCGMPTPIAAGGEDYIIKFL